MTNGWIMLGVALLIAAIAAVTDTRTGRIPNWLCLPPLVLAPCFYFFNGGSLALVQSLVGIFAGGLVPYLLFRSQAAGGGDVKLLAAIGALTGVRFSIESQLFAYVIAAAFAICLLAVEGRLSLFLKSTLRLVAAPFVGKSRRDLYRRTQPSLTPIRLGLPIFLGVLLSASLSLSAQGGPI